MDDFNHTSKIPREVIASRFAVSASVPDTILADKIIEALDQLPERPSPLCAGQRQKIQLVRAMKAAALEEAVVTAWGKKPRSERIGETFYKNYGWSGGVDEFSLVNNCELTLTALERLKQSGAIKSIPPAEIEVLRPITKFRNDDLALKQIEADVAGIWTTETVKVAIGSKPKKAIKKTTIVEIRAIAVGLRVLLAQNNPAAASLIGKIIALCAADLDLTHEEIANTHDDGTETLGDSPSTTPAAPVIPLDQVAKPAVPTPELVPVPPPPASDLEETKPAEPPAAVPAASAPAVQTDFRLEGMEPIAPSPKTSDVPPFISPPSFDGATNHIRFKFIGQGSAKRDRQAVATALGFIALKKQEDAPDPTSPFWSCKTTSAKAPAIIQELQRRLRELPSVQLKQSHKNDLSLP